MKEILFSILFVSFIASSVVAQNEGTNPYVQQSKEMLQGIRAGQSVESIVERLSKAKFKDLAASVDTKEEKLAFWINIYNAFIQRKLLADPKSFDNKGKFYTTKFINIAGIDMSFDDIEHGILRYSRVKISLGLMRNWFAPGWEKDLRNTDIDGRIHFALNCGALDCPPIAIYDNVTINQQLDKITKIYLKDKTHIEDKKVTTIPLFSWFRYDFGGLSGVKSFLKFYEITETEKVSLRFSDYDWTLATGNYIDL